MIVGGIDVGSRNTKVAILSDGKVLSYSLVPTGASMKQSAELALHEALSAAGLSPSDIRTIIATGAGRKHVDFAHDQATEVIADARGINWFYPSVRTVIDVGAEESRVIKCDGKGRVSDFAKNEKCAAGVGAFVEGMATALEIPVEDMEALALASQKEIQMNVTCVVFAESEVVSLIHSGVAKTDIVRAILDAIATRTASMVRRLGVEKDVALVGGVASNAVVMDFVKKRLGVDDILIPENPYIVAALGAALIARD